MTMTVKNFNGKFNVIYWKSIKIVCGICRSMENFLNLVLVELLL